MKNIKFRAWDKKRKEMVYFDLDLCNNESRVWWKEQIEGNPIMRLTNLPDKNKKLIYEKDLVKVIFNERIKIEPIMCGGDIEEEDVVTIEKSEIIGEVRMRTMGGVGFVIKSIRQTRGGNDRRRRELGSGSTFEGKFHRFKRSKMENVEIIGNIYENANLLNQ